MQLGVVTNPRNPLISEIRWLAEHGFNLVDLTLEAPHAAPEGVKWTELKPVLTDHNLPVICRAATYLPLENPAPLVRQAALDEARRALDVSAALGAELCTIRFRGWPAHLDEATGYEYYRQLFGVLLKHGAACGVAVALENRAENEHQLKWFREIFKRLPDLKLAYHLGHGNVGTLQSMTREYLFALADRLAHVRISDNDGRHNAYLPLGAPARGGLDFRRDLQTLRSFSYDGPLALQIDGDREWATVSAARLRTWWG
ncbi:MAG: sugar phosphate isomerase/epimerase, partial [Caldilineaceae bacterium]|nr:sugar phosphate isomerase/epimerase [Caldilineaceae bacterium]